MIGVYGGSFDPVHWGHIHPVVEVADQLSLTKVLYIPAKLSPFKSEAYASENDRLKMLELALIDERFIVDDREMQRQGKSYSIDTLRELSKIYPDETLVLIMGGDSLLRFSEWYQWESMLELVHVVVTSRPSYTISQSGWLVDRVVNTPVQLQHEKAGKVLLLDTQEYPISSTAVRDAIRKNGKVSDWLPIKVEQYIVDNQLYLDSE